MSTEYKFLVASKGMFNDALEKKESSIYHLTGLLIDALYDLYFKCVYYDSDIDPAQELGLICDEFKAVMVERFLPRLVQEEDADKSADTSTATTKAIARLEKSAGVFAFLGGNTEHAEKVLAIIKEGRRNSSPDQKMLDEIHKLSVNLGADCKPIDDKSADSNTPVATESTDKAAPVVDKTASPGSSEPKPTDLEAKVASLTTTLAERDQQLEKAVEAAEQLREERDNAMKVAEAAVLALEQYGQQPLKQS